VSPVRALFIDFDADGVAYNIQVLLNQVQAGTGKTLDTVHSLIDMVSHWLQILPRITISCNITLTFTSQ